MPDGRTPTRGRRTGSEAGTNQHRHGRDPGDEAGVDMDRGKALDTVGASAAYGTVLWALTAHARLKG